MRKNIKRLSGGNTGIRYKRYEISSVGMHWHDDFYEIELVTKGEGIHRVNGADYEWKKGELIGKIITYLYENFRDELTLDMIAEEFYITKNYLCSYFKKNTGKTVMCYIKELRLAYAAKLVALSDISSIEICSACGYSSVSNFLRDFKREYGMSPLQMRKSR